MTRAGQLDSTRQAAKQLNFQLVLVEKLNQVINAAFKDTRIEARLAELGASPLPGSPTQFQAFIQSEMTKYAEMIRVAKIAAR